MRRKVGSQLLGKGRESHEEEGRLSAPRKREVELQEGSLALGT
jgi:hypothetical protein